MGSLNNPSIFVLLPAKLKKTFFEKLKPKHLWSFFDFQQKPEGVSFHSGAFQLVLSDKIVHIYGDTLPSFPVAAVFHCGFPLQFSTAAFMAAVRFSQHSFSLPTPNCAYFAFEFL